MSINFFESECKEPSRTDRLFGLCDDQNGTKAYSDATDDKKWIATVKNENSIGVTFTPIDNCIIILKEGTQDKESTCDGMLTSMDSLYLVELKDTRKAGWKTDAIEQLENTTKLLIANHDLASFRFKKAFVCNKARKHFQKIDNEANLRFFRTYGFRIDAQAEVIII